MNTFNEVVTDFEKKALADVKDPLERARLLQAFWQGAYELFNLQAHIAESMSLDGMRATTGELYKEVISGALDSTIALMKANGIGVEIIDISKLFNDRPDGVKLS